ncbi:MAG: c-type cytochrome biogenesis protein CcmI [Betaproteobacteria bacterium]|nr:c-type cytochrome biogenesis protein CcmI [Betaproteobacteria bacterium]
MMTFWILAIALALAGGVWLARPLWRPRVDSAPDAAQTNLAALRDQMRELDVDLAAGTLSEAQHREARAELETRVLSDVIEAAPARGSATTSSRLFAIGVTLLIPLAAFGLYGVLGHPAAIGVDTRASSDPANMTPEHFAAMTEKLAAKLRENPDDARGWLMLGRANKVLERPPEAVAAYEQAAKLQPEDPEILADYAEVLAVRDGGRFSGLPAQLIQRALKAAPDHPKTLTMAGAAAFESKNYTGAIAHWQRLLKLVGEDAELRTALMAGIAEASRLRTVAATPAQGISGRVQLDPQLADKVDPADVVFIYARGPEGGMPVAALRRHARDLPITFRLDDTYAINPANRLSSLPAIIVGARISKGGDAMPQAGDLQGASKPVKLGASNLVLTIKEVVQ